MHALVWHGPRSMALEVVPEPTVAPGEVLVEVEAVGICGSEISGYLGENALRRPPLIMGHEFIGRVVDAPGAGSLLPGQRVVVNPLLSCGDCRMCHLGLENLCEHRALLGAQRPGAFAERVAVPERNCLPVPETLPPVLGVAVEPLACALRAVELGHVGLGDRVAVFGAGAIGLFAVALAARAGASMVAVVDVNESRLRTAQAWGATHLLNARTHPGEEILLLTASLGADVVIDAVGRSVTRREAIRAVRPGGRVVLVGLHEAESPIQANDVVRREIHVTGSFAYRVHTFEQALSLIQLGIVPTGGGWYDERTLAAGPVSFEELVAGAVSVSKVILRP
ncbi:zinc-dependent alcohol dehydrogenase [Caldinitratiruptor microaerophilus]|uniref:Galactitol-1-phosphate 5-dehydrogenase n=1 Tax=Caldinitratiruptor microaerophilus TaxID=671077 RepID=A0AA35CMP9_9FIRM|nr:alcohol dehydrogenase catalytic domain-containing protein [Caldinitratiruptor microaerophilus]BDG60130.1 galactitol-1-phosphate 5-dehydrogenase [Caldinitratiruptor microaerophilus]